MLLFELLSRVNINATSEMISGAERYAGVHNYTMSKGAYDHYSIFIILFIVISIFIVVCAIEYKKEKNKDRY